jgi:hypothetical protein
VDTIAIVDDRQEMRETVAKIIKLDLAELQLDWNVISCAPLPNVNDYLAWVQENDVCVLVLDENLSEEHAHGSDAVSYPGHAVASLLRKQKPDLPQFIVTSVAASQDLDASGADLEDIIARRDFVENSSKYVQRMVRAGQSFVGRYEDDLAELTRIADAVVNENVSQADLNAAGAIRAKLQMAYDIEEIRTLQNWLIRAEEATKALEGSLEKLKNSDVGKL